MEISEKSLSSTLSNLTLNDILNNSTFRLLEILDENSDRCFISLLGSIMNNTNEVYFVLKIKKKEFSLDHDLSSLEKKITYLLNSPIQVFNNDIYYKLVTTDLIENKLKIDLIYPADYKVIDKYRKKGHVLFKETPHIYLNKTQKFIDGIDSSHNQWIKNILYDNAEEILYEEKGSFIITQDYNSKDNKKVLNCLGIPYIDSIRSVRNLNETHLDLLENFYYKGKENMARVFNVEEDKIRCFVHYPPNFYYFHVHYLHVDLESSSTSVNRAIDLFSIIQNIKMKGDYYQSVDLEMTLQIGSKLFNILTNN